MGPLPPGSSTRSQRHNSFGGDGHPLSSYCSSVPEERPLAQTPAYGDRHQVSSFPDRIPSFKTDVDNIPTSLTQERLAEHNCDSFGRRGPAMPYPAVVSRASQDGRTEQDDSSLRLEGSICSDLPQRLGITGVVPSQAVSRKQGRPCDKWKEGSIVEVFSASVGQWYAAQVGQVEPQSDGNEDIVTVVFYIGDQIKQKSIYRTDAALAALGTHTFNELPPGFETRPSQSKPGQLVYFDLTAGIKYASLELAWHVHFERLKQQPAGCETVACVQAGRGGPRAAILQAPIADVPSPMKSMTLAELAREDSVETALPPPGKVALPSFGDGLGSQGAYLDYVGAPSCGSYGAESASLASGYQVVKASAPQRPLKLRNIDPALQKWQEDAFSEWRR